jgi:hypothetical protein
MLDEATGDEIPYSALLDAGDTPPDVAATGADTMSILYTSGTTGPAQTNSVRRIGRIRVFHGQLWRGLAHHHRCASQAHLDASGRGRSGAVHLLRGPTGASCRVVPAATISRRCGGSREQHG